MPNLDLSIAKIMHGDTPVLRIMEGDTRVWPSGTDVIIDGVLPHITSSVPIPGSAPLNSSLTITLTPDFSYIISQITITMGGVDITSSSYNEGTITIPTITGDVLITVTTEKIEIWEEITLQSKYFYRGTAVGRTAPGETNTYYDAAKVACVAGDKFKITGRTTGNSARLYMWLDSEEKIISISNTRLNVTNQELTSPTNAAYFIINAYRSDTHSCYKLIT